MKRKSLILVLPIIAWILMGTLSVRIPFDGSFISVKRPVLKTADPSGLEYFFRWQDYSYSAGGNTVWLDSSGNGRNATNSADALCPVATDSSVYFNAAIGNYTKNPVSETFLSSLNFSHFWRMRLISNISNSIPMCDFSGGNQRAVLIQPNHVGGTFFDNSTVYSTDLMFPDLNWHVYGICVEQVSNNNTWATFYRDGVQVGNKVQYGVNVVHGTGPWLIGCYYNYSFPIDAEIKYIMSYSNYKSPTDAIAIQTYLAGLP